MMCRRCDFEEHLGTIEEMIDSGDYDFAYDTLDSIAGWVRKAGHITPKQIAAVANIQDSSND